MLKEKWIRNLCSNPDSSYLCMRCGGCRWIWKKLSRFSNFLDMADINPVFDRISVQLYNSYHIGGGQRKLCNLETEWYCRYHIVVVNDTQGARGRGL